MQEPETITHFPNGPCTIQILKSQLISHFEMEERYD
jgi:hypothetical protein